MSQMIVAKETNQWASVVRQGYAVVRDMKEAGTTQVWVKLRYHIYIYSVEVEIVQVLSHK